MENEEQQVTYKRPFLHGLFWILVVGGNPYISIGEDETKLRFMLWGKNHVEFEVSTRGVKSISDLVLKIERGERNGDIDIHCFPTTQDQMEYIRENFGDI